MSPRVSVPVDGSTTDSSGFSGCRTLRLPFLPPWRPPPPPPAWAVSADSAELPRPSEPPPPSPPPSEDVRLEVRRSLLEWLVGNIIWLSFRASSSSCRSASSDSDCSLASAAACTSSFCRLDRSASLSFSARRSLRFVAISSATAFTVCGSGGVGRSSCEEEEFEELEEEGVSTAAATALLVVVVVLLLLILLLLVVDAAAAPLPLPEPIGVDNANGSRGGGGTTGSPESSTPSAFRGLRFRFVTLSSCNI